MDIFEVEQTERVSREEVAARLRKLADMLARHNDIEFERGGMRFTLPVPDEVELKIELEVDTLDQLAEALEVGVDAVLLDNMAPETLRCMSPPPSGRDSTP